MDKVQFSPSKNNTFTVRFNALTKGEVFALINALRIARKVSAVAKDLSSYLSNGIYKVKSFEAFSNQIRSDAEEFGTLMNEEIDVNFL